MFNKFWGLCAVVALSATVAYADEVNNKVSSKLIKEPTSGIELVYVKGGCYQMGDIYGDGIPDEPERPVHKVCVDNFFIGKFEVTQGQWKLVMGNNPSHNSNCGDNCPVENVSWNDVQDFIGKLNSKDGGDKYRLPTEAEFEFAQRSGGKSERYSGGNDVNSVAWYISNSGQTTHPVGTKVPNGLGIYDMSGNVWELVNDWYGSDYFANSPSNNPSGPISGVYRVKRGGCVTGTPDNQRVSRRDYVEPGVPGFFTGFRILKKL